MIWSLGLFGMILWLCLKRLTSQFSFLYSANSQQQSTQESLYCKVKTQQYLKEIPPITQPQAFDDSGKEKLAFKKKKPLAEPGYRHPNTLSQCGITS